MAEPKSGTITIDWSVGRDLDDVGSYVLSVTCDPPILDDVTREILAYLAATY